MAGTRQGWVVGKTLSNGGVFDNDVIGSIRQAALAENTLLKPFPRHQLWRTHTKTSADAASRSQLSIQVSPRKKADPDSSLLALTPRHCAA